VLDDQDRLIGVIPRVTLLSAMSEQAGTADPAAVTELTEEAAHV
jgi:hypothetical protein